MSNAFEPRLGRGERRQPRREAGRGRRLAAPRREHRRARVRHPQQPVPFHHANEELLIVLSGTPELRTPAGLRELQPGEVVSFPCGHEGAHRLRNASSEPCRLLFISEINFPDIVSYPDTGTTLAVTAPSARTAFPRGSDGPLTDLIAAAFDADPGSASQMGRPTGTCSVSTLAFRSADQRPCVARVPCLSGRLRHGSRDPEPRAPRPVQLRSRTCGARGTTRHDGARADDSAGS